MKSSKIISLNNNPGASDNLLVKAREYNKNERFEGVIHLDHQYIQYANHTVNAALEVKVFMELNETILTD